MPEPTPPTPGWTRIATPTGRYEYQFQGRSPAVRKAEYLDAFDYLFLVMDVDGWLYRIPVRVAAEAEAEVNNAQREPQRLAEEQLCAGLREFTPRPNAPYDELDRHFAVDVARARDFLTRAPRA